MAEAIAIHVASLMGMKPIIDSEQQSELFIPEEDSATTTNIQGLKSTKFLEPAIYVKDGEVAHEDLFRNDYCSDFPKGHRRTAIRVWR